VSKGFKQKTGLPSFMILEGNPAVPAPCFVPILAFARKHGDKTAGIRDFVPPPYGGFTLYYNKDIYL
jgi:hypothetical protein